MTAAVAAARRRTQRTFQLRDTKKHDSRINRWNTRLGLQLHKNQKDVQNKKTPHPLPADLVAAARRRPQRTLQLHDTVKDERQDKKRRTKDFVALIRCDKALTARTDASPIRQGWPENSE